MKSIIYLATKNKNKVKEIREILGEKTELKIESCPENITFPEETGKDFKENACLKAKYLSKFLKGKLVAGEDSGLIVKTLGGLPGINSARFAGKECDDKKNINKLLHLMSQYIKNEDRKAKFITVICLITPEETKKFQGEIEGNITFSPRGQNGFGYDPVFEIPFYSSKTFAELSQKEKNKISHRTIAFNKLADYLLKR